MSAPFKATAADLHNLADALTALNNASIKTGVEFAPWQPITLRIGETAEHIQVSWDQELGYVVDDRIGS